MRAIPVSNAMILAGAIPATAINLWKRHPARDRPLLDIDIALLLVPATLGGTTPGVLLNVLFPEWLVSAMLVVLLTYTAHKTLSKGRSEWRKETEATRRQRMAEEVEAAEGAGAEGAEVDEGASATDGVDGVGTRVAASEVVVQVVEDKTSSNTDDDSAAAAAALTSTSADADASAAAALAAIATDEKHINYKVVAALCFLWVFLFAIAFLRGGKGSSSSPVGITPCLNEYWRGCTRVLQLTHSLQAPGFNP
jgi:hypothetical protein